MNEKRSIVVLVLLVLFLDHVAGISQVRPTTGIDGFGSKLSEAQRKLEEQFRSVPSATNAREELRRLTSEAHIAGSPEDYATAVYVRDQMRSFGLNSDILEYQVLLPHPRTPSLGE